MLFNLLIKLENVTLFKRVNTLKCYSFGICTFACFCNCDLQGQGSITMISITNAYISFCKHIINSN